MVCALESGSVTAEHACVALLPLAAASQDARRDVAAFPDLLPMVPRRGGARPLLLQMVSLGNQRAQELALGCPRGDGRWAVVVFVTSAAAASLLLDVEPPACVAAASLLAAAAPRWLPLWLCHPPELSSTLLPPVL